MTNARTSKQNRPRPAARRHPLVLPGAVAAAIAVVVAGVLVATAGGGGGGGELALTGEVNSMGLPVVETPGTTSGSASAGGIQVTGARWAMGQVPLEVAVRPSWTLVNTSSSTVALGEPHAEVRAGCCPGAFTLGAAELAPGESTTLSFELSMHPGMDGWHDFAVHVPVSPDQGTEEILDLVVTGDFRGPYAG